MIRPHGDGVRLHCTMIRHESADDVLGDTYTLYLEHLGGFLPILKGKKVSKIRPEFVIYDPTLTGKKNEVLYSVRIQPELSPDGQALQWTNLPANHPVRRGGGFTNLALELSENEADYDTDSGAAASYSPRTRSRRRQRSVSALYTG